MSASLVIALLALVVSGVALYRTQLAPGRIRATVGVPRLRVYPFHRAGRRWVVPELHITIAFTNTGARPAIVDTARVVVRHPEIGAGDGRETFRPRVVLREPMGLGYNSHEDRERRLEDEAREWMPALVPAKETVTLHIIFQSRAWDAPRLGTAKVVLEVKVRKKSWKVLERWSLDLSRKYWHHVYGGLAVPATRESSLDLGDSIAPPDLEDTIAAEAEEAFGPEWWEELQRRGEQRDREAAKARGEPYDEDFWKRRLR